MNGITIEIVNKINVLSHLLRQATDEAKRRNDLIDSTRTILEKIALVGINQKAIESLFSLYDIERSTMTILDSNFEITDSNFHNYIDKNRRVIIRSLGKQTFIGKIIDVSKTEDGEAITVVTENDRTIQLDTKRLSVIAFESARYPGIFEYLDKIF